MIGWIGTVSSVVGSFLVAFHLFVVGYLFFMVGAASWLLYSVIHRNRSLGTLNLFFLVANIIGLYNAWG